MKSFSLTSNSNNNKIKETQYIPSKYTYIYTMGRYSDRWEEKISKYDKLGCCGNIVRVFLLIINILFFVFGLTVFIAAAVLKWGNGALNKFADIKYLDDLVKVGSIGSIAICLMVLGAIIVLLSFVGILGLKFMNRFFLIIYEIIVAVLFLAHLVALLVLIFGSAKIEDSYKNELSKTLDKVNSVANIDVECDFFKTLSTTFKCCGVNNYQDFKLNGTVCCDVDKDKIIPNDNVGCRDKSIQMVKENAINLLIIPSGIILVVELFALSMVPCMIGKEK